MFSCLWFSDTPCFIYFSDKTVLVAHVFLNKHQINWSTKIKFINRSVDGASATKTVDAGSILGRVKIPGCPLQHLDVLRGRLLGSHVNFHWQLGGQNNHQPCSSNDISHCSSSQLSTELDSAVSSF